MPVVGYRAPEWSLRGPAAGGRVAIVEDVPGVTRDRNYADVVWNGRALSVVDTGGFEPRSRDRLMQQVQEQARLAVEEAAAVVLVTDGREGLTALDEAVANTLRRAGKPLFVAVNDRGLVALDFGLSEQEFVARVSQRTKATLVRSDDATAEAMKQVKEYLEGQRTKFDLPLDMSALSEFQRRVLTIALKIPRGQYLTYGDVAKAIGKPQASRAVGQALGHNPVPIIVPFWPTWKVLAIPKSTSFSSPSVETMMLAGFTSRWKIPFLWA